MPLSNSLKNLKMEKIKVKDLRISAKGIAEFRYTGSLLVTGTKGLMLVTEISASIMTLSLR